MSEREVNIMADLGLLLLSLAFLGFSLWYVRASERL
jgi:hypothetical protein